MAVYTKITLWGKTSVVVLYSQSITCLLVLAELEDTPEDADIADGTSAKTIPVEHALISEVN